MHGPANKFNFQRSHAQYKQVSRFGAFNFDCDSCDSGANFFLLMCGYSKTGAGHVPISGLNQQFRKYWRPSVEGNTAALQSIAGGSEFQCAMKSMLLTTGEYCKQSSWKYFFLEGNVVCFATRRGVSFTNYVKYPNREHKQLFRIAIPVEAHGGEMYMFEII